MTLPNEYSTATIDRDVGILRSNRDTHGRTDALARTNTHTHTYTHTSKMGSKGGEYRLKLNRETHSHK